MPRPRNLDLPEHPAIVDRGPVTRRMYGHQGPCAQVQCPYCKRKRWYPYGVLRQWIGRANFTGACVKCWKSLPKARTFRSSRNPGGRRVLATGYVVLGKNAIEDADLSMFDAMRGKGSTVFEHRWVMAKHLDRPLRRSELVDHRDGCRSNNRLSNLRIYVRGENQEGSCPGHGTYYHEWQMAEAGLRVAKAKLREMGVA